MEDILLVRQQQQQQRGSFMSRGIRSWQQQHQRGRSSAAYCNGCSCWQELLQLQGIT
jgi:hypothetical protein